MTDFPTFQDLFRISRDEALIRSRVLTREIVERDGTDANALVAVGPNVGDAVIGQLIRVQAAIFLDTAAGEDLDKLVFDRYNIIRKPASPALGVVDFTTTVPNPTAFTIPADTKLTTSDGTIYLTTVPIAFPAVSTGPVSITVTSQLAGLTQHAASGEINNITDVPLGAPTDLVVSNPLATFGAGDQETDAELRARARLFYTTAFRGTLKAIERGALSVPGIRTALAFEAIDECAAPARFVEVVVADQLAEELVKVDTIPPDYEEQSAAGIRILVNAALEETRAAGIFVLVTVAVVKLIGVTLALRFRVGFDVATVSTQARSRTVDYVNTLRPGDDFIVADLETALMLVPGLEVLGGEVVAPATDQVAGATEVFRTTLALVIVQVCGVTP